MANKDNNQGNNLPATPAPASELPETVIPAAAMPAAEVPEETMPVPTEPAVEAPAALPDLKPGANGIERRIYKGTSVSRMDMGPRELCLVPGEEAIIDTKLSIIEDMIYQGLFSDPIAEKPAEKPAA